MEDLGGRHRLEGLDAGAVERRQEVRLRPGKVGRGWAFA